MIVTTELPSRVGAVRGPEHGSGVIRGLIVIVIVL
ncbi:MAG: hypothetical protein JWM97_2420 [Phycisphaerales bacterium]|nr:hypothetical protein [Phycisphaerales bacterium]